MTKYIPPADAAKQLSEYGVKLLESLKEIRKVYPEQVRDLYRAIARHIMNDDPTVVQEVLR